MDIRYDFKQLRNLIERFGEVRFISRYFAKGESYIIMARHYPFNCDTLYFEVNAFTEEIAYLTIHKRITDEIWWWIEHFEKD